MESLSDLPDDMLFLISKLLKKLEDFVSFRSVSKSLRAAAKFEYFEGLRLRTMTPYLMLPGIDDNIGEFYSLIEEESIVANVKVSNFKSKKFYESLGWLLAVEEDGNMSLLDPFSGIEIPLPHQNTFPEYDGIEIDGYYFIHKMVLSFRPSETSDFILMVIAGNIGKLGFWRLGDKAWNSIDERIGSFKDVVYHKDGQFYAIGNPGVVFVLNLSNKDNHVEVTKIIHCEAIIPKFKPDFILLRNINIDYTSYNLYILKAMDDRVLMITRSSPKLSQDGFYYLTSKFQVYEIDIATGKWKEIYNLGSMSVFLGTNSTIVVDASRFTSEVMIKANHIYFTDDDWEFQFHSAIGGGKNIGVYDLETATVEPFYFGETLLSLSKFRTPMWITPCF